MTAASAERAIVLDVAALGESDLLVTLLGESSGRIRAVARGARRSKTRFAGGIDLFDSGRFEIEASRRVQSLPALGGIFERENLSGLRSNLKRFAASSFCVELMLLFTREAAPENKLLFPILRGALAGLNEAVNRRECNAIAIWCLFNVLSIEGLDPLEREFEAAEVREYLHNVRSNGLPDLGPSAEFLREALAKLIAYTEYELGQGLKTAEALFQQ
jgi:DNA repair protein RecO